MTPEKFDFSLRLERIFMPYAQRQRRAAYVKQIGAEPSAGTFIRFAHYTSATAAMNIITEKSMWMRNTKCMSDYSEIQHGFAMMQGFFKPDNSDRAKLYAALDECSVGVAEEAVTMFNGLFQDTNLNTYIASISEHDSTEDVHGRLSMWRAFGGNTARVAFVFKVPYGSGVTEALQLMFSPVAYLSEPGVHDVLREVAENVTREQEFLKSIDRKILVWAVFTMLLAGVTCLKHEGFHEEREWRVIYSPYRQPSPLMKSITREISGVPQIIHLLPLNQNDLPALADIDLVNMFDRLIIGPSPYPWPMKEAFIEALTNAGVKDAKDKVSISGIPIRA